jgi:hypothetical protein
MHTVLICSRCGGHFTTLESVRSVHWISWLQIVISAHEGQDFGHLVSDNTD